MQVNQSVLENTQLAADQGWKASFHFTDGRAFLGALITAADWEAFAVKVERVGERHLQPTIIFLKDIEKVEVDWS